MEWQEFNLGVYNLINGEIAPNSLLQKLIESFSKTYSIKDVLIVKDNKNSITVFSGKYPHWQDIYNFGVTYKDIYSTLSEFSLLTNESHEGIKFYTERRVFKLVNRYYQPLLKTEKTTLSEEYIILAVLGSQDSVIQLLPTSEKSLGLITILQIISVYQQNLILKDLLNYFANELIDAYKVIPFHLREVDKSRITPEQMDEIIPVAYTAYFNEQLGPTAFVSSPRNYNMVNLSRQLVSSYTVIDFDFVIEAEFILNTSQQVVPEKGEFLSLFFVRDTSEARAGKELHSMNVIINEKYNFQLLQTMPLIKANLMVFGKHYKQMISELPTLIDKLDKGEKETLKSRISDLLFELRRDLATHIIKIIEG